MAAENEIIMVETRKTIISKLVPMEGGDDENDPEYHSRSINDRFYKVTEHLNNDKTVELRTVETEMSEEQIENFEIDWELYWKPALSTKRGAVLHGSILN